MPDNSLLIRLIKYPLFLSVILNYATLADPSGQRGQFTRGQNSSGSTVVIYKGPLPWAPLARARTFGLKTANLDEDSAQNLALPVQAAETISENNDEDAVEGSGEEVVPADSEALASPDYVDQEREQGSPKNIRADLHESLRQPLKRLSDRQLALLLKQVRRHRRREQQQSVEEGREVQAVQAEQSRKEMLKELRQLLREPADGQKLIRPKLLTNINIVPNEWHIYPPKRGQQAERPEAEGGRGKEEEEAKEEGTGQGQERESATEFASANGTAEEVPVATTTTSSGSSSIERTTEIGMRLVDGRQQQKVQQNRDESGDGEEAAKANATIQTSSTEPSANASQTSIGLDLPGPTSADLANASLPAPTENEIGKLTEKDLNSSTADGREAGTGKGEESGEEERRMLAQLSAHWHVVELKFATEMENAMKAAGQAMARMDLGEKPEEKPEKGEKNNSSSSSVPSALLFSSKTWEPGAGSNESLAEFDVSNENISVSSSSPLTPAFANDLEAVQLADLSEKLRQIRLRYETLKRQYLAKIRLLNEKKLASTRRIKASAATTFLDGANLDLGLNKTEPEEEGASPGSESSKNATSSASIPLEALERRGEGEEERNRTTSELAQSSSSTLELVQKKMRLEEFGREQELARKVLSSEVDEEQAQNGTAGSILGEHSGGIGEKEEGKGGEGQESGRKEGRRDSAGLGSSSNSTMEGEKGNGKPRDEAVQAFRPLESGKKEEGGKQKKKNKHEGTGKMATLAELAEELGQLEEAELTGRVGAEQQNGTSQSGLTNEALSPGRRTTTSPNHTPLERPKLAKTGQGVGQQIGQNQSAALLGTSGQTKKGQKRKKGKGKNGTANTVNNANTSLLQTNSSSIGTGAGNGTDSNSGAAQLEEDFGQDAGLPSSPIRVIPTPKRRILTTDWLPKARLNLSREGGLPPPPPPAFVGAAPPKVQQFDAVGGGRKKAEGRMGGKQIALEKGGSQGKGRNSSLPNGPKAAKGPRPINQSASIGTRPPLLGQAQQQRVRRPIPAVPKFGPLQNGPHQKPLNGTLKLAQPNIGQQDGAAQPADVGPQPVNLPGLKLKGVSQVQVEASRDQQEEGGGGHSPGWSDVQLQAKLREEMGQVQKDGNGSESGGQGKARGEEGGEDLANLEEFARLDEQAICEGIACNFETGSLCEWEPSVDELNPEDPRYRRYMMARRLLLLASKQRRRRRHRRELEKGEEGRKSAGAKEGKGRGKQLVVVRTWHNWVGRYRNRLTGIARADVFSTRNQRFAASYVRPGQRSSLTGRLLGGEKATIRFRVWEATRDLQLRVCCDGTERGEQCVFRTDRGVKRGSRRWLEQTATCPEGTKKVIFECRNLGRFQGACGLDNIQLLNDFCPSVSPANARR